MLIEKRVLSNKTNLFDIMPLYSAAIEYQPPKKEEQEEKTTKKKKKVEAKTKEQELEEFKTLT